MATLAAKQIWGDDDDEFFDAKSIPDSDTDSSFSTVGECLKSDLKDVLSGSFRFTGSTFYYSPEEYAPNPGLNITGVGPLRLPLSQDDARLLSLKMPISFAEGIEGTILSGALKKKQPQVYLENPAWKRYMEDRVLKDVCEELGIAQFTHSKPRIEFRKLDLLGPGSSSPTFEEIAEADGVFATVVFILPSVFEGGHIQILGAVETKPFNISNVSRFSTTILAWYTGEAAFDIAPIISGYQLILSYRLIHTNPHSLKPGPRNKLDPSTAFRRVLCQWKDGNYERMLPLPLAVHPLSKTYTQHDLGQGARILIGPDLQKVNDLLPIAQELGFSICLAHLECSGFGLGKEHRRHTAFGLISLNNSQRPLYLGEFDISDDVIIPNHLSKDGGGDVVCSGNGFSGSIQTVLIIYREQDEPTLAISLQGPEQSLRKVQRAPEAPTAANREVANAALAAMKVAKLAVVHDENSLNRIFPSVGEDLLDCALEWKDVDLWHEVFVNSGGSLKALISALRKALVVFHVGVLQDSIENLIRRVLPLRCRVKILRLVRPFIPDDSDVGSKWVDGIMRFILASCDKAEVKDIPALLGVAVDRGLGFVDRSIIPNVSKRPNAYVFLITLAKGIYENRDLFPSDLSRQGTSSNPSFKHAALAPNPGEVTNRCLMAAVSVSTLKFQATKGSSALTLNLDRISEIIELCFAVDDSVPCKSLLENITHITVDGTKNAEEFDRVYTPLVALVKEILLKNGSSVTLEPFKSFFKAVISFYLVHHLSPASNEPAAGNDGLRAWVRIGCGRENCHDCQILEGFVNGPYPTQPFELNEARRRHLEQRLDLKGLKGITHHTTQAANRRYTLHVTKHSEAFEEYGWEEKRKAAYEFMKSVGCDGELNDVRAIMGVRWKDVVAACESRVPFHWVPVGPREKIKEEGL